MLLDHAALGDILGVDVPESVTSVGAVTHDSRDVVPGGAFVAIPGFLVDGVDFVPQALSRGASLVVAEREVPGVPTAIVPDARTALARLAVEVTGRPSEKLTVYGITGTNGKTTSSYVLHAILSAAYGTDHTGLMTTAEIAVGDSREVSERTTGEAPIVQGNLARMVDAGVQHVVLETSSHGIHLHRVLGTHYAAALFTNLTRDHIDLHGTMEDYYLTKRRLFEWTAGPKLSNVDDVYGKRLAEEIPGTLTFGLSENADYRIVGERVEGGGTAFELQTPRGMLELKTPLLGDYNVHNVAGASAIALEMGMDPEVLVRAVETMDQVPGRFERVPAALDHGIEVVVDYAHTDIGLQAVLDVARDVAQARGADARVICIYGAAGDRDKAKRPLMGQVASRLADVGIITTDDAYSEDPQAIADEVATGADLSRTTIVLDRRKAIELALSQARPGDVVVVAGKGHERVQHLPDGDIEFHDATVVNELLATPAG
ncbi:UDP-N-acetylmuramoyl-L-alanyl-D-glutamate--2,6-diaminopimelate ligase [Luteipulveratus mongoliensis]|uniref:UDP-N-acetylmuramyl-tripeptide synthetase n=1 Tax=Luteipulveratus mongoliensis TaxID=571913 RepID=A0A0K1JD53_9MICO|nr:UDP-N-acetylmuramoyl-L-alanyl-D-glutamate--2,6-diaminopimelate ligase [Luteipulveratus mongoliensis]AKU14629.1 UDP-N-acetylmuramoylalanyl-D-glutamate--2,6-diaminopimelate ligase [Luteipulveratus mongoliensis]AKU18486.1 UDP-N-acetylmuramoylalanyl-D-glutamate--2,6-diaminopimelate ligase [Luteipulveratus mongoliensis]